jgi:hypothetical protein
MTDFIINSLSFPRSGVGMQVETLQRRIISTKTPERLRLHSHAGAWERCKSANPNTIVESGVHQHD